MPPLLLYFCIVFPSALLLEGLILLPFKLSLAKNWRPFLLVNLATQTALTFTVGLALVRSGTAAALVTQFPAGLVVMIAESLLYEGLFKTQKPKTALAYGMVANLASWAVAAIATGWISPLIESSTG